MTLGVLMSLKWNLPSKNFSKEFNGKTAHKSDLKYLKGYRLT
jgi:hypothetical protein